MSFTPLSTLSISKERTRGFTLVELVAVIVLLAIVSVSSARLITGATAIYRDGQNRLALVQTGQFAVERITRELRNALPGSVRVSTDHRCLEFVPIVAASNYLDNLAGNSLSTLRVIDFSDPNGVSYGDDQVVIAAISTTDFYNNAPTQRAGIASIGSAVSGARIITLDAATRFAQDSPQRRLFVIEQPVSFCVTGSQLIRHQGNGTTYTYTAAQSVPPANGVLLAEFVQLQDQQGGVVNPFDYRAGTPIRNGVIAINLVLRQPHQSAEWLTFNQQVLLRNTP